MNAYAKNTIIEGVGEYMQIQLQFLPYDLTLILTWGWDIGGIRKSSATTASKMSNVLLSRLYEV